MLLAGACSVIGTQTADKELKSYADREALGAPSTLPTSLLIPTTFPISTIPGLPTVPKPTSVASPTTTTDEEGGGQDGKKGSVTPTTAGEPHIPVPPIPDPTTPQTTTTIRLTPSKFSGDSDFCEAGSNFYRAANVLFAARDVPREDLTRMVVDYLKYLDQTIDLTPAQMYVVMAPVRDVREQLRSPMLNLASPDAFRNLAADVFDSRPDLIASVDFLIQWCGADPSPRKSPRA